jgi:hypothetical protein
MRILSGIERGCGRGFLSGEAIGSSGCALVAIFFDSPSFSSSELFRSILFGSSATINQKILPDCLLEKSETFGLAESTLITVLRSSEEAVEGTSTRAGSSPSKVGRE